MNRTDVESLGLPWPEKHPITGASFDGRVRKGARGVETDDVGRSPLHLRAENDDRELRHRRRRVGARCRQRRREAVAVDGGDVAKGCQGVECTKAPIAGQRSRPERFRRPGLPPRAQASTALRAGPGARRTTP